MNACPLCGCDDLEGSPWPANRERTEWVCRCGNPDCGCEVRDTTKEGAAARWNRRPMNLSDAMRKAGFEKRVVMPLPSDE